MINAEKTRFSRKRRIRGNFAGTVANIFIHDFATAQIILQQK